MLSFFPLLNIIFLILIYRVHKPIFWIVGVVEILICISGIMYIESEFNLATNKMLYYLALTGIGSILGVAGFFIAISLNQRHLYKDMDNEDE